MNRDRRRLFKYLIAVAPVAFAMKLLAGTPRRLATVLSGSMLGQAAPPVAPSSGAANTERGPVRLEDYPAAIRLACVGDSITEGAGTSNKPRYAYPSQLRGMLDDKWVVKNFGVSGTTLLNEGDFPYQQTDAIKAALAFQPNVVVVLLGTNDSKPQNWKFKELFTADYLDLIGKFRALASTPRIFVGLPLPSFGEGNYGINEAGIEEELPLIRALAHVQHLDVIDLHSPFAGQAALLPDRVHPNDDGAALMARTVYKALTGRDYAGPVVKA